MAPRQRPAPGWRLRGALLVLASFLLLVAATTAGAQQILFTVQVVALSDLESAGQIQTDLLRQGYPAYIVRSSSSEGAVFRVRVGAFANRPAALLYSEAMPQVAGGQPVPALAEGIPPGLTPLIPRLVLSADIAGLDARLLLIGESLTLRTQQRSPLEPAQYAIMAGGSVERVTAWQLRQDESGERVIVRDLPLWPESWEGETSEVREGYQSSLVGLIAERLGLDQATVRAARYGTQSGVPKLVVVERFVPGALEGPEMIGLGLPATGMTPSGPLQFLVVSPEDLPGLPEGVRLDLVRGAYRGELEPVPDGGVDAEQEDGAAELESPEAELVSPEAEQVESEPADTEEPGTDPSDSEEPGAEQLEAEPPESEQVGADQHDPEQPDDEQEGEGAPADHREADDGASQEEPAAASPSLIGGSAWYAQPDGPFARLTMHSQEAGTQAPSWRAALGTPLWSGLDYLVAYVGTTLLIYDFLPRN